MSESYENIPQELKERDQWLMWDSTADTPRRPHWRGDFYELSWSDPEDWHTFEEAVEAANERESWGIGYVMAADNDDHPRGLYTCLDLDGVLEDSHGDKKDWVPDFSEFLRDGYAEYSPSGTGIHIPLVGQDVPDWWSDSHFSADEHEGVEFLSNKFVTFTGDQLRGTDDSVADTNPAEFLTEAYHTLNGEYPKADVDDAERKNYNGDEWLDADKVEEALNHLSSNTSYPEWRNIGFAVHDWDSTSTGKSIFESWSRGAGWDENSQNLIDKIWENSTEGGNGDNITVATLIHKAKNNGWDVPRRSEPPKEDETVVEDEGEERTLPSPEEFSVNDGKYGSWEEFESEDGTDWYFETWTNFQIEVNSYLTIEQTTHIDITVHPATGDSYDVTVEPTVFNEVREFKAEICSGLTTTFEGGQEELNAIKRFVGTQEAPYRSGTHHMGLHEGEWVTPKGVLTAEGWTDDPDNVYVERGIGSERKWEIGPDNGDDFERSEVQEALELLPQTRDKERLLPVLGWFYSAPLRPLIHSWENEFNLMFVQGDTGSGKTTTISTLWEAFGMGGDPLTADDTKFTLVTTLGSSNAVPMWFDEYKPSDMADYEVDRFWNEIRKTTIGGVSQRGNADKTTTEYHLHAPAIVSGEERVAGSAEERRGIFTTFRKDSTDPGSDTARAYAQLTGGDVREGDEVEYFDGVELQQHALAYYRFILSQDEEDLRELWRKAGDEVAELLTEIDVVIQEDLVEQGLQTIMFGTEIYQELADKVGAEPPVSKADVKDAVEYVATRSQGGANRKSHLDTFFEVSARAASSDYLTEGEHYKFVKEGEADEELRMNLATSFDKVSRYARDHEVAEDLLNSKNDYYERIRDLVDDPTSYVVTASQNTPGINRAVGVNRQMIEEALDDFSKSMFTAVDEDEGVDATRIRDLQPGYDTVTAEVLSVDNDLPDKAPDAKATIRDNSGAVDCISWDGNIGVEEGGHYVFKTALVGNSPDGAMQVQVVDEVTEVKEIQQGAGHTGQAQTEDGQGDLDAVADGGEHESLRGRIKSLLRETGDDYTKAEVAGKLSEDPEVVQRALDRLAERGEISTLPDGRYTLE